MQQRLKPGFQGQRHQQPSIVTADRMTHLKIVAVSLICAIVVGGTGIAGPRDRRDDRG
jgi:hypothetical protein